MKQLFSLLLLLLTFVSFSQDEPNYIGLYLGVGIPVGSFNSSDLTEEPSFMNPGMNFLLNSGIFFNDYFGVASSFIIQTNTDNLGDIELAMESELDAINGAVNDVTYDSDGWGNLQIMLGPSLKIGKNKLWVDGFFVGGLVIGTSPDINITLQNSTGFFDNSNFPVKNEYAFGLKGGSNIRYFVGRMSVGLRTEYSYSKIKYPDYYSKEWMLSQWSTGSSIQDISEVGEAPFYFQNFMIAIGINYQFSNIRSWRALKRKDKEAKL